MCSTSGADGSVILHAVILHHARCILRALGVVLCSTDADLHDLCLINKYGSRQIFPTGGQTGAWMHMSGRSAVSGTGASMPAVRKPCALNQQIAVQQMACKTTIIFSTSLLIAQSYSMQRKKMQKHFEKGFRRKN